MQISVYLYGILVMSLFVLNFKSFAKLTCDLENTIRYDCQKFLLWVGIGDPRLQLYSGDAAKLNMGCETKGCDMQRNI